MKNNFNQWHEFDLCGKNGLFECKGSKTTPKRQLKKAGEGIYPYITTKAKNNGTSGYYNIYTENENVITVDSAVLGTCFYQAKKFSASDHVELLIPKFKLTKNIALFIVSVLNKTRQVCDYDYNEKRSQTMLKKEKIPLPAKLTIDNIYVPNWEYMENYISKIEEKIREEFNSIVSIETKKENIDTTEWKDFHLYDLFNIDMGTKLDKVKMKTNNPVVDFVGRSAKNQGVTAKVNKVPNIEPYKAGYITLALGGAYLGSCFIQKNDFYTSQNVVVLIPKMEMSQNVKQFICTSIFVNSQLYYKAFIEELNKHIKTDFVFKLPITDEGLPNYEYMEKYITQLEKSSKEKLRLFNIL